MTTVCTVTTSTASAGTRNQGVEMTASIGASALGVRGVTVVQEDLHDAQPLEVDHGVHPDQEVQRTRATLHQADPPDRDAPGEEALRDTGGDDPVTLRDARLGVRPARPRGACPGLGPAPGRARCPRGSPGWWPPARPAGPRLRWPAAAGTVVSAAAARVGRRRGGGRRVRVDAVPSSSWSRPAPRSSTGRWRSGRRRSDSGSERRRTTDWRSVTCSMRPTRPPRGDHRHAHGDALAAALVDGHRLVEVRGRRRR